MIFQTVAEQYLHQLETGSNPCRPATIKAYRSILKTHLVSRFGSEPLESLAQSNNLRLKELVRDLRAKYAPASIQLIALTFRNVLEFPRDHNGLPIHTLRWEPQFYDLPTIANQKQPTVTVEQVQSACADPKHGHLYLLLTASGLRISEALALVKEDCQDGAIHVRDGKTPNATRYVDLAPSVIDAMAELIHDAKPGQRIFPRSSTVFRRRQLVPGFHSLRRFRASVLRRSECRDLLIDYWLGHSNREMGTRYAKQLLEDKSFRKEWAARGGIGFEIPTQLYYGSAAGACRAR